MSGGPGNGATVFPLKLLLPDQLLLDLLLLLCLQRHHQNKDWNDHRFLDTESAGAVLKKNFPFSADPQNSHAVIHLRLGDIDDAGLIRISYRVGPDECRGAKLQVGGADLRAGGS